MNRWMIVICCAGFLCCATSCCDKGKNRVDIVLEGPWILYQDTQFDDHGIKVPVLVAIAPIAATGETIAPGDLYHHHSPQLSTGDGFYIKKGYLKKAHIYCLFFDDKCAPKGLEALVNGVYPQSRLLGLTPKAGPKTWEWVKATKSNGAAALILPMPDSYSNDGVWNMRFAANGDEKHSIGLQLHYTNGPRSFILRSCDESSLPTVANCNNPVADSGQPEPSRLENTGTLRLQMRAPDNTNACDWHVRYAWDQAFKILGADFGSDYRNLEPAASIDANGKGKYLQCNKSDPAIKYPKEDTVNTTNDMKGMLENNLALPLEMTYTDFVNQFDTNVGTILDLGVDEKDEDPVQWSYLVALKSELDNLNPNFPRISQLMLIAELGDSSETLVARLRKKQTHNEKLIKALDELKTQTEAFKKDADTKNGADCRAAVVMVQ